MLILQLFMTDDAREYLSGRERPVALDYIAAIG